MSTITGSGSLNNTDNNVDVVVVPQSPEIFLTKSLKKICRRGAPDEKIYGLDPETETDDEQSQQGEQQSQQQNLQKVNTTVDVEENWFKMGLVIVNKSTEYYLVVDQLVFIISAEWGKDTLKATKQIGSGYCGTDRLYTIRPTPQGQTGRFSGDKYEPLKRDDPNNLTLFIDGVPIPEGPPKDEEEVSDVQKSARGQNANTNTNEFIVQYLPPYTVEMHMMGSWIDKNRETKANFTKIVKFSLSSSFYR